MPMGCTCKQNFYSRLWVYFLTYKALLALFSIIFSYLFVDFLIISTLCKENIFGIYSIYAGIWNVDIAEGRIFNCPYLSNIRELKS